MNGRELRIPVSFGHLAAVEWGRPDGKRILALHGWQDNAFTFQPLAQHLSPHLHIVALDFCGHGQSSHLGPGANYNAFHYACDILHIVNWLKWDTFSILAHSMGAIVAIKFITLFPSKVENLISLDMMYPSGSLSLFDNFKSADFAELFLKLDSREAFTPQQEVTWEEALRQYGEMRTNLSEGKLGLLLSRSLKPVELKQGGQPLFVFTRDHRIKLGNYLEYTKTSVEATMNEIHNYRGTWLAIMNDNSWFTPNVKKLDDKLEEKHTSNCKWFRVVYMKDVNTHFFHMDYPERVAPHIEQVFASTQ